MRKILLIIIVIACLSVFFLQDKKQEEIRVRIIPNSNNAEDLKVKEEVKDVVLCYLNMVYDESYEQCKSNITKTTKDLEKSIKQEITDVDVSFGKHTLYNKTYNDNAIKNTETYTLYVVIGSGKGDNWWGSIYPKFLSVNGDTEIQYESLLANVVKKIKEK